MLRRPAKLRFILSLSPHCFPISLSLSLELPLRGGFYLKVCTQCVIFKGGVKVKGGGRQKVSAQKGGGVAVGGNGMEVVAARRWNDSRPLGAMDIFNTLAKIMGGKRYF